MSQSANFQFDNQTCKHNWSAYYKAVKGRPPRDTLLTALANFDSEITDKNSSLFAVDLGCGEGRDTGEILRRGWRVLAIDGEQEAINLLLNNPEINHQGLQTCVMQFENLVLPESVDLINASFSLPFCPPEYFPRLWDIIITSLRVGGRFCGQLFGNRDSWAIDSSMNHHTRQQIEELLQSLVIEMLEEEEYPGKTALGEDKHWHMFHIVARKK
ncbi:MAG: class I SAM-dependent methyltransferase [Calothrix sp. MO_192.B10]|nr:class I SAM-dependent methyltransferase [Calothrix sp. MO_192.B10]